MFLVVVTDAISKYRNAEAAVGFQEKNNIQL